MTLKQLFLILRARWLSAFSVFIAIIVAALAISLVLPKQYTATARVLLDVRAPDPVDNQANPSQLLPSFIATQVDVIKSDRVAQAAARIVKLDKNSALMQRWREQTEGRGSFLVWLGAALQRNVDVVPSHDSDIISISFTGTDPQFSALMANAFAQAYIETNLELHVDPARQYATWFSSKISGLRSKLEQAQSRLTKYEQKHGLTGSDRADLEYARLADLSRQLAAAQAAQADVSSRASVDSQVSPDVLQNPIVQSLRAEVIKKAADLKELSERLGPSHPQYLEAQSQLDELRAKLRTEMREVASSIKVASGTNAERISKLQTEVEAQRQKVMALERNRDNLSVLQRDVESAQSAYDLVTKRFNQTNLQSEIEQTNITVLSPATQPLEPSKPNIRVNLAMAVFIGSFLGIATALLLETLGRTVRAEEDLSEIVGTPVLASYVIHKRPLHWAKRLRIRSILSPAET